MSVAERLPQPHAQCSEQHHTWGSTERAIADHRACDELTHAEFMIPRSVNLTQARNHPATSAQRKKEKSRGEDAEDFEEGLSEGKVNTQAAGRGRGRR
jgi:hypothetical protein